MSKIYLTERDIHRMIKESVKTIMENITPLTDVIRLYHSTNLEGIEGKIKKVREFNYSFTFFIFY